MTEQYIALVPDDGHWPHNEQVIALGRHCFVGAEEPAPYRYLSTPWNNEYDITNAASYCDDVYDSVIEKISKIYNERYDTAYNVKYYDRVFGYWLLSFIHQAYDKYTCINQAARRYPDSIFLTLDSSVWEYPQNFSDYQQKIISDQYAHQIYSQIIEFLGYKGKSSLQKPSKQQITTKKLSRKSQVIGKLISLWNTVVHAIYKRDYILVVTPYFKERPRLSLLSLVVHLKGKVIFPFFNVVSGRSDNFSQKLIHSRVPVGFNWHDIKPGFESLILYLTETNIPSLLYEGYDALLRQPDSKYFIDAKLVYSANAHCYNSHFMTSLSLCKDSTPVLIAQHGGGYGTSKIHIGERWERKISDIFLTWGWSGSQTDIEAMPVFRKKTLQRYNFKPNILYVSNTISRYCRHIRLPAIFEERCSVHYLNPKVDFLKEVCSQYPVVVRPYPGDQYKWGEVERLMPFMSEKITLSSLSYVKDIRSSRLIILDNNMTSLLETMAMNIPTLLFADEVVLSLRDDAVPYFQALANVGILHDEPTRIASFIRSIEQDVDAWWCSEDVQLARLEFVNRFARNSKNPVKDLACILRKYAGVGF